MRIGVLLLDVGTTRGRSCSLLMMQGSGDEDGPSAPSGRVIDGARRKPGRRAREGTTRSQTGSMDLPAAGNGTLDAGVRMTVAAGSLPHGPDCDNPNGAQSCSIPTSEKDRLTQEDRSNSSISEYEWHDVGPATPRRPTPAPARRPRAG